MESEVGRLPGHTAEDDIYMARQLREIFREFHEREAARKASEEAAGQKKAD